MLNAGFTDISQYDDVEAINYYHILLDSGVSVGDALEVLANRARDNSRTPMQWSAAPNAGFTTGTPWLGMSRNWETINVEAEENDPHSILQYYRRLVRLRKEYPIISDGDIRFLETGNEKVLAYERSLDGRTLTVVTNYSGEAEPVAADLWARLQDGQVLVTNCGKGAKPGPDPVAPPYAAFGVLK